MIIYVMNRVEDLTNIPSGVEWIELRLDICPSLSDFISQLNMYKIIITDRWIEEGGKSKRNVLQKISYYKRIGFTDNIFFDIEIDLLTRCNNRLLPENLIISHHNFHKIDIKEISNKINQAKIYNPFLIKIIQSCDSWSQVNQLYSLIKKDNSRILWSVTGFYGRLQRLLSNHLKSWGTFVSATEKENIAGQLTCKDVEIYPHLLDSQKSKWGGIIGKEHVVDSFGIKYYNTYFKKHKLPATYLPIVLQEKDLKPFFHLVTSESQLKQNCYGLSITMPYKMIVPQLFIHKGIYNLITFNKGINFYNTDLDAFYKIKDFLPKNEINSVLIYGSGNMAKIALKVFADNNVFLSARNVKKLQRLKFLAPKAEIIDQITPELYFDLIINTSPIGMKGENFSQSTGIKKYKYVIDLPYSEEVIPLQTETAQDKYFSGKLFWQYQSQRQLQIFKEKIENDQKHSCPE